MGNTVYTIASILAIIWGMAYLGFKYGGAIHTILAIAIFMVIFQLIKERITKK